MVTGARTPLAVDLNSLLVPITAGANRIGKVMEDRFVTCGALVFVSDVNEAVVAACRHPGMRADAGDSTHYKSFLDAAVARLGALDVLVNNAGTVRTIARWRT